MFSPEKNRLEKIELIDKKHGLQENHNRKIKRNNYKDNNLTRKEYSLKIKFNQNNKVKLRLMIYRTNMIKFKEYSQIYLINPIF